jgi:hypothetical protein
MEIKPPAVTGDPRVRRDRTLPLEGEAAQQPSLPLEGEPAAFDRLLAEELGEVQRTAATVERTAQLMDQARNELELGTRHLVRAGQLLDLVRRGLGEK